MKKYFVLAAIAMVAFAGCKKEEKGMVTLTAGFENAYNQDKQTYNCQLNRIMFNGGDMMIVNGSEYGVTPLNDDQDPFTISSNSYRGALEVPATVLYGQAFLAGYPAEVFDGAADGTSWNLVSDEDEGIGFRQSTNLICDVNAMDVQGNVEMNVYDYRIWPMVAYDECGSCVAQDGRFLLKNTVAILTPSFLYGVNWFAAMNTKFNMGYDMSQIASANDLPEVSVSKVVISSSYEPLHGAAHLEDINTTEPHVVMDAPTGANYIELNECGTYDADMNPGFTNPNFMGQIPVAPFVNRTDLTMDVYFTIGNRNFVYRGVPTTFDHSMTLRSVRTVLQVNMRDDHTALCPNSTEYMARFVEVY